MVWYAGGNLTNPNVSGYAFCLNKLSDLGMSVSYSGKSNWLSFWIFNPSLVLFGLSLIPLTIATSHYFEQNSIVNLKLTHFTAGMGIIAGIAFAMVGLTPKNLTWAIVPHCIAQFVGFFAFMMYELCCAKLIFQTHYPNVYAWMNLGVGLMQLAYFLFLLNLIPYSLFVYCTVQKIVVYGQLLSILIQSIGFLNQMKKGGMLLKT